MQGRQNRPEITFRRGSFTPPQAPSVMQKTLFGKIRKIVLWTIATFLLVLLVLPLLLYNYSLSLLETMPEKPTIHITHQRAQELWSSRERCTPQDCASTTPYWPYRWLAAGAIDDSTTPMNLDAAYENMSTMASQVAIHHMRQVHFSGSGMLWWHITHTYLTIWLQRNWSTNEIASKFREIGS